MAHTVVLTGGQLEWFSIWGTCTEDAFAACSQQMQASVFYGCNILD